MEAKAEKYVLDDQVGYLLRLASQRHAIIFQDNMSADLTPAQFSTLIRLADCGEVSQNQLGRLSGIDIATIKGVVDRLKCKGLVATRPDSADKRRSLIALTVEGRKMIADLCDRGRAITRQTLSPLTPSEQAMLTRLLSRVI